MKPVKTTLPQNLLRALAMMVGIPLLAADVPHSLAARVEAADSATAARDGLVEWFSNRDNADVPSEPDDRSSPAWYAADERRRAICWEAATRALERFPQDSGRWELVVSLVLLGVASDPENLSSPARAAIDAVTAPAARAARRAEMDRLVAAALAAPDATPKQKGLIERTYDGFPHRAVQQAFFTETAAKRIPVNLEPMRTTIDYFGTRYPTESYAGSMLYAFSANLARIGMPHPRIIELMQPFLHHSSERLRTTAESIATNLRLVGMAPQFTFTALDGREIDLEKLRGKVVLIDFWATWCGPCREELPNVKRVYAKYRDQGFEVLGVTAENVGLRPDDTAAQRESKIAAAKRKLTDAVREEGLMWPQYFDPLGNKNPISRQFGIVAIPQLVLIGKDGVIITAEARGEKLEPAVQLALASASF